MARAGVCHFAVLIGLGAGPHQMERREGLVPPAAASAARPGVEREADPKGRRERRPLPSEDDAVLRDETVDSAVPRSKNFLGLDAAPLTEPIVTDRPDFTESTQVVPWGRVQLEGGYTFTYDRERDLRMRDHLFPEFLLRVGLVEDWELRVGWAGWSLTETLFRERNDAGRTVTRSDHDDGGSDLYLGFKWHLLDQQDWRPGFAIIPAITAPTGAGGKTSGDVDPEIKVAWAYDLTARLGVAGNVNVATPTSERGRFFQTSASVTAGYAFTDWLGGYVEYFGLFPNERGTDCAHTLNGGLTFPITDHFQLDVRTGVGLNEEADDFFVGAGFAVRF